MPKRIAFHTKNFDFINELENPTDVVMLFKILNGLIKEREVHIPEHLKRYVAPFQKDIQAAKEKALKLAKNGKLGGKTTQTALKQAKEKRLKTHTRKASAKKIVFDEDINQCYQNIIQLFSAELQPKTPRQTYDWKNTLKTIKEKHNISLNETLLIKKKAKENTFYGQHFLSLTKLLRKNNDGVMYLNIYKNLTTKTEKHVQQQKTW
jgi:hypothetical protein